MLKPADALLGPDPRFRDFVVVDGETGVSRPMSIDYLRTMIAKIELNSRIAGTSFAMPSHMMNSVTTRPRRPS
jgi:hypothetical protein